jgi:paraquat-inducible protein A
MTPIASHKLSHRNKLSLLITIISFFFLVPGIFLSMLSVQTKGSINAEIPHMNSGFLGIKKQSGSDQKHISLKIFDTTRSIINTVQNLWTRDYYFVAAMILLFSIIVPFVKGILLLYNFFSGHAQHRKQIYAFIRSIGKWSMCDVYIVAIFLCYLSTGATQTSSEKSVNMMGYNVDVHVLAGMQAQLHVGFWCFLTYCLLSLIALQIYEDF